MIPENDKDIDDLLLKISDYHSEHAFIVVVSEGDENGVEYVCEKITAVNPSIDLRVTKLGHLQRGGNPSAADRMLAIRLGVHSVKVLCAGDSAKMVGILNNTVSNTPMQDVVKQHVINEELQGLLSVFCR